MPRATHRLGVKGIALGQTELAPDHLVLGTGVADDIDPLDVDPRAFTDIEREIDYALVEVAGDLRLDLDERKATIVHLEFYRVDAPADGVAVVPVAFADFESSAQVVAADVAKLGVDRDFADAIAFTFADGEGKEEAGPVRRQLRFRSPHFEIDVAVLQVEAPQQLLVEIQPVRIIFIRRGKEAPPAFLAGVDHLRQTILAERVIADEHDLADQRHRAVVDLEHDIDTVLIQPDDLRIDAGVVVALLGVQIEYVLSILFGQCRREHRARLQLHFRPQLIIGQLVVAFEGHAVDQRILCHAYQNRVAFSSDAHVLEQAGGVKRLQTAVQPVGIERVARLHQHVREDCPGLDSLVALNLDRRDRTAGSHRSGCGGNRRSGRGCGALRRRRYGGPLGDCSSNQPYRQQAGGKPPRGASTNQKSTPLIQAP